MHPRVEWVEYYAEALSENEIAAEERLSLIKLEDYLSDVKHFM